jgi:transketolase
MAFGGRLQARDYFVFVLLGDGELNEGQVWEAALAATTHQLGNLVAIVDRNEYSLDGLANEVARTEPILDKWRAFGWDTRECDGHDISALTSSLREIVAEPERNEPAVVVAHTTKGKGISYMEAQLGWHLGYLAAPDREAALAELRGAL